MDMRKLSRYTAGAIFLPCLCFAQGTAPLAWKSFRSSSGFSVKYPANWIRKGISRDRLTILSSKGGAEGIVIKNGQAMLTVTEASAPAASLSQVIDRYTQEVTILSRRAIAINQSDGKECKNLKEIVSKQSAVLPEGVPIPAPYIINTEFFCQADHRVFTTVLRNFEGDEKQAQYQTIALKVTKSLRVNK